MRRFRLIGLYLLFLQVFPSLINACPLCVDASPFKRGMQWAIVLLLPVPFALAGGLIYFIRKSSREEPRDT